MTPSLTQDQEQAIVNLLGYADVGQIGSSVTMDAIPAIRALRARLKEVEKNNKEAERLIHEFNRTDRMTMMQAQAIADESIRSQLTAAHSRIQELEKANKFLWDYKAMCMEIVGEEDEESMKELEDPKIMKESLGEMVHAYHQLSKLCKENDSLHSLLKRVESERDELRTALKNYADRAYCDSLKKYGSTECLGWKQKIKSGQFGDAEMDAHRIAAELMGAHRGIYKVLNAHTTDDVVGECGVSIPNEVCGPSEEDGKKGEKKLGE